MKQKIGIYGSAISESDTAMQKATNLGEILSEKDVILITGACGGVVYEIVRTAFEVGKTEIWGYSPELNRKDQESAYPDTDINIYAKLFYVPQDYRRLFYVEEGKELNADRKARLKYRNVISVAKCDGAIMTAGRWGTLNEFTILHDLGKVIGILTGTGGIADELESLHKKINKPSNAIVVFDNSPEVLVDKVLNELDKRRNL